MLTFFHTLLTVPSFLANSVGTAASRGRSEASGVVVQAVEDEEIDDASFRRLAAFR